MTITTADTFTVVVRDSEAGNIIKPYADVTAGRKLDMSRAKGAGNRKSCILQAAGVRRQRKAGTSRVMGNNTFWVMNVLEAHKERLGKVGIS